MPTWWRTVPITKRYLRQLGNPVARVDVVYQHPPSSRNHAAEEINFPVRNALAIGATVMLLCNYVIEEDAMNGAIGTVKKIVYANRAGPCGPRGPRQHHAYAIVDFRNIRIRS